MRPVQYAVLAVALGATGYVAPVLSFDGTDEVIVARISIEPATKADLGYALGAIRSARLANFVEEAMTSPMIYEATPRLDDAATGTIEQAIELAPAEVAAIEQMPTVAPVPAPRPTQIAAAVTPKPVKPVTLRRQVTTVSTTSESRSKRSIKLRLPLPSLHGAYR